MMGHRHAYDVWRTVDAFDYAVEHLSMYERMMHASKSGKDKARRWGMSCTVPSSTIWPSTRNASRRSAAATTRR